MFHREGVAYFKAGHVYKVWRTGMKKMINTVNSLKWLL